MARRRTGKSGPREIPAVAPRREWVGGRISPPFFDTESETPQRAQILVWLELPSGQVLGHQVRSESDVEGGLAATLTAAFERPLAGPARRPDSIRVADDSLAAEVRAMVGLSIPIVVAPTPELDELLDFMLEQMPGGPADDEESEEESYFEGGRVSVAQVEQLFAAADLLFRTAPWDVGIDGQAVRLDIPALGVEGACVSVIGALGESRGMIIYPTFEGYQAFLRFAERLPPPGAKRLDLGTGWLALAFEHRSDLPAPMRREAAAHAWPVAAGDAYPRVERRDRDGALRPLVERDLEIVTACALSLTSFVAKHADLFDQEEPEPVCESYFNDDDLEVRFTMPYEASALFTANDGLLLPPASSPPPRSVIRKVGRNDPCPCGSGKKYKKCHLPIDQGEARASQGGAVESPHQMDRRLLRELESYAERRFGAAWVAFTRDFSDADRASALASHWAVFHFRIDGRTVLDWYLEERGRRLAPGDREWLAAQAAGWLSVWEVIAVEPGSSVTLHDLLTAETRRVREEGASRMLIVRDAILARVIDCEGTALLCGVHPRPLPPHSAAEVVERLRRKVRRRTALPVERLRDDDTGRYLIHKWEQGIVALDRKHAVPPKLENTDGEPLVFTVDHFEVAAGARAAIAQILSSLDGVFAEDAAPDPPTTGKEPRSAARGPQVYVFERRGNAKLPSWENTVIGRARLTAAALAVETNSRQRADALRQRLEQACGDRIRHRGREHEDPLSDRIPRTAPRSEPKLPPAEAAQLMLDFKQRHYAGWPDQPLPALGGMTARQAVRTARGRAAVDILLKDIENTERRANGAEAFDFAPLRQELGLD